MKSFATTCLAGGLAALAQGASPVAIPQQHITGGTALQAPLVHRSQSTTVGSFGAGAHGTAISQGKFVGGVGSGMLHGKPPNCGVVKRIDGRPSSGIVVVPGYQYYGGYYYGSSAMRDLADAEWAKVRLMEEELRLKEEQLKLEYETKLAELEAKKEQMVRQDQKSSWDRAAAMYPPLLDPQSKMRTWYEHLLKQAREATDRWGQPIRVPELDAPDYPEIFAHRAAQQINLKPLPLSPPQAEAAPEPPTHTATASEAPISVGEEIPD
ncbi:MAG: hypothetical protein IT577_19080 [Verrucomicrobiae bacterium]|nr:hypothetical protein [Verrucomicrobiae bacterium]